MEVIVFCGLQGAGKSSFYAAAYADTHLRINLDMLRTRNRERVIFEACLACRQSCVIDNTNPTPADRARYVAPAKAAGARVVACFFESSLADALMRNAARGGRARIPDKGVAATARRLVPPGFAEGFDEIRMVRIVGEGRFAVADSPAPAEA